MMTNLFSSFDPSTNIMSMNWLSTLIIAMIMPVSFWLNPWRSSWLWNPVLTTLHKEFKLLTGNSSLGTTIMFISVFTIILKNNFLGLFPYIFTSTSHLSFTLTLALPLWVSFMLFGWINNTVYMLSHLEPVAQSNVNA